MFRQTGTRIVLVAAAVATEPHHVDSSGPVPGAHGGLRGHPHRGAIEGLPPVEPKPNRQPTGTPAPQALILVGRCSHDQLGVVVA